jgi:hypothetical protein
MPPGSRMLPAPTGRQNAEVQYPLRALLGVHRAFHTRVDVVAERLLVPRQNLSTRRVKPIDKACQRTISSESPVPSAFETACSPFSTTGDSQYLYSRAWVRTRASFLAFDDLEPSARDKEEALFG